MKRKLLDGTEVPAFDLAIELRVITKCPNKYKLTDMETGEEYIGQLSPVGQQQWKKITEKKNA
jgi:hypothetical protein